MPRVIPPPNNTGPKPRVSWNVNARLMRALYDGPSTIRELVEETGLAESTVRGYVKALHAQRLVAIVDRLPAGNNSRTLLVYKWAPDTKDHKLIRVPPKTRAKRYRARKAAADHALALCFLTPVQEITAP